MLRDPLPTFSTERCYELYFSLDKIDAAMNGAGMTRSPKPVLGFTKSSEGFLVEILVSVGGPVWRRWFFPWAAILCLTYDHRGDGAGETLAALPMWRSVTPADVVKDAGE